MSGPGYTVGELQDNSMPTDKNSGTVTRVHPKAGDVVAVDAVIMEFASSRPVVPESA
jgi:hypothetical protein